MTVVRLEADGAIRLLDEMGERAKDLSPVMRVIAADLTTFVDTTFDASMGPTGEPWEPLADATVARRRQGSSKPLVDTGILRGSITAVPGTMTVIVGTNVPYAGVHQFGGEGIPARPFFPLGLDGEVMDSGPIGEEWDLYEEMIATYIETGEILEG